MVRTYPVVPLHFDPACVAAWSAAIALHLLAFLLLLIPATYQAITALPRDQTTVRFIPREEPKPIEPLPVPTEPEKVEVVHKRQATPVPAPLPTPTATVEEAQGIILPAAEPTAVQAAPTIAPSTPLAGAQLQYRSNPPPSYPIQALRNHEQGTVLLRGSGPQWPAGERQHRTQQRLAQPGPGRPPAGAAPLAFRAGRA